jgi:hypothetical protein
VKAEAFASRNRRLEEVDLGRIQAGRPEGRPLIAAEWTELTAIGIVAPLKEKALICGLDQIPAMLHLKTVRKIHRPLAQLYQFAAKSE